MIQKSRPVRPWRIPPALLRAPGELIDGDSVLSEFTGATGLVLWQGLRDAMLWGVTLPERRSSLFVPGAGSRRQLLTESAPSGMLPESMDVLSMLLLAPSAMNAEMVSRSCLAVARWAEAQGKRRTALAFAQAAAVCAPDRADAALETGRLAVAADEDSRAETWLRRTIGVARQS